MRCLVIINPVSGRKRGLKIFEQVRGGLESAGWVLEVNVSDMAGSIHDLALNLEIAVYDVAIIVGGDGSLNEFVNGMMKRMDGARVPLGLIPAGTGNSLLYDLGQLDPKDALQSILTAGSRRIDLLKVSYEHDVKYAFNVVGWGLPSTINQKSEKWKFFGGQRYNIASLQEIIRNPRWPVRIILEEAKLEGDYSFFMACNTRHTGNGMVIAPRAQLDDGLVDVVMLRRATRFKLVKLFAKIFKGEHVGDPLVEYQQVREIALHDESESTLIIDGEIAGRTPFRVEVMKKELELLNNS